MHLLPAPNLPRLDRVAPLPFSHLGALRETAERAGRVIELTGGNPVDPVPTHVREALAAAADSHGYPPRAPAELLSAICGYLERDLGVSLPAEQIAPLPGTKGFLTSLPENLGLGPQDLVVSPAVAYPSYVNGTHLAGATAVLLGADEPVEALDELPAVPRLIYQVSPSNPEATVVAPDRLARMVAWARDHDALVVSDEAYLAFDWTGTARSILHPEVSGGSSENVVALHSLSKHSNMAGYRSGFVAGDPGVVGMVRRLAVQSNGFSAPIAAASAAAWSGRAHVHEQRTRYQARRDLVVPALRAAGFELDDPAGSLYLWVGRPGCDDAGTAQALAELGVLTVPGRYYRFDGRPETHVRLSLTSPDEDVREVADRLGAAARA